MAIPLPWLLPEYVTFFDVRRRASNNCRDTCSTCQLLLLPVLLPLLLLLLLLWLPSCRHLSRQETHPSLSAPTLSVVQSKTCHFLRAAAVYFKIGRALCRLVLASLTLGLLSASRAVVAVVAVVVAVVPAVSFGWPKSFHTTAHPTPHPSSPVWS